MKSVTLFEGAASVWVSIQENGDVWVQSEDGDTEVVAAVPAAQRQALVDALRADSTAPIAETQAEALVLELIRLRWQGRASAPREFHDYAQAKGLAPTWFRWP